MKRKVPAVVSREYKVVLEQKHFRGSESEMLNIAHQFWVELSRAVRPLLRVKKGNLSIVKTRRTIRFYDTTEHILYQHDYILRERKSLIDEKRELTLKCRHQDRYIAQSRDMHSNDMRNAKMKFEEDIKVPFIQLYSFSTSTSIHKKTELKKLKHAIKYFPGLSDEFDASVKNQLIQPVHDTMIQEIVITGGTLEVGPQGENAECALIIWYGSTVPADRPLIVEFSFRYGNKLERYARETAQNAFDVFEFVQEKMTSWLGQKNATKTGLVFADI